MLVATSTFTPATRPRRRSSTFEADAVLFDMDGTLTDSIAAVEAAWGSVAREIGLPEDEVIAATYGKRAIDNLKMYKPHLEGDTMERAVTEFEQTILDHADAYKKKRAASFSSSSRRSRQSRSIGSSPSCSSRRSSIGEFSFITSKLWMTSSDTSTNHQNSTLKMEGVSSTDLEPAVGDWEAEEEDMVDMSVRIFPGVRNMIDSLPEGQYAVATSGAKTYALNAMSRVGIVPPAVTITADDPRLERGKPFPDPFLLAAKELGYPCENTVIFEDSPSGIKAAVASGATVIAVLTSHTRDKIDRCGAHFVVDTMENVSIERLPGGRLSFSVEHE